MHTKALVFCVILLLQACRPLVAQKPDSAQPDSPGLLQRLVDRAREARGKVHDLGGTVLGLAGAYYEEYVQPATVTYTEWASDIKNSVLEKIKTTIDNYTPFKANPTDPN